MMIFRLDIPVRREEQELFLPRPSWSQQYRLNKLTAAPALLHSSVTEQYLQDHRQIEIVGKIAKSIREERIFHHTYLRVVSVVYMDVLSIKDG